MIEADGQTFRVVDEDANGLLVPGARGEREREDGTSASRNIKHVLPVVKKPAFAVLPANPYDRSKCWAGERFFRLAKRYRW